MRLIDADALVEYMDSRVFDLREMNGDYDHYTDGFDDALQVVEDAPTIDAVEVVRCRDCKWWMHMEEGMGDCTNRRFHLDGHADPSMKADDFCSCAERRDDNA